jgi:hypothetical protein
MDIIEKFLRQISYKFPKGYPDINDDQDKKMLFQLVNEAIKVDNMLIEATDSYDERIKSVLKVTEIPKCETPLSVGKNFNLRGKDEEIWSMLYPIKPLKADGQTPTAGSGNGEIATYWAYQHNVKPIDTVDGRTGESPDLIIGGIGVEVKAYETKTITLGKFAGDTENNVLLNTVFGTLATFTDKDIKASTANFNPQNLLEGFKIISEIYTNKELRELSVTAPFFNKMKILYDLLGLDSNSTAEKATVTLLRRILWTKLNKKPNLGKEVGYILNVDNSGNGDYYKITKELIDNIPDENILNNGVYVKSAEIGMNFGKLFK